MKKLKVFCKVPSVKQLDDMAREYVRLRDKMTCQRCNKKTGKLEVAHFYSRANKAVRWDEDNIALLCFSCHYCWAHRDPNEFALWWKERLGGQKFSNLLLRAHGSGRMDRSAVKLYLDQLLKELKNDPKTG